MDFAETYVNKPTIPEGPRLHSTRKRPNHNSTNRTRPAPFRARSMPDFSKSAPCQNFMPRRQRQGATPTFKDNFAIPEKSDILTPTVPQPFPLRSLARHERAIAIFEQKKIKIDNEERQRRVFKAQPLREDMLVGATFVPTLGTAPLTKPEEVVTASRDRADRRAEFDSRTAKRIAAEELHRAEQEAARVAQEDEERRKHWKQHGFRARPVPSSTYAIPPTLRRSVGSDKTVLRLSTGSNNNRSPRSPEPEMEVSRRSLESSSSWSITPKQTAENQKTPLKLEDSSDKDNPSLSPYSPSELIANVKRVIQRYRDNSPRLGTSS